MATVSSTIPPLDEDDYGLDDNTNKATEAPNPPSQQDQVQSLWSSYTKHLTDWFSSPDIEAAQIVLATAASHFHKGCDPVWLFILGPSSGDKTSICINSLLDFPETHMKGEITPKTFLSGYTGTAHPSLLHKIGSGILAFKDFTTFMSKRPEDQTEIAAQLREIYDGSFVKDTGKGITIPWKGKITVIAAATPALERAWASRRDLGERFLQVRLSRKDGLQQAEYAQRQRGKEEFISTRMRELARLFFQSSPTISDPRPMLSTHQTSRIAAMAEFVSHCRGIVPRHPVTNQICDLPQIENSARLSKALASLVSNHAALFRRTSISEEDMKIGRRVALNSIPATRALVLDSIPLNGSLPTDRLELQSGLPQSTLSFITTELESLGILRIQRNEIIANELSLTTMAKKLWNQAFSPLEALGAQPVDPLPH